MNDILGFIVLTSPLSLIVLWVPICIVLTVVIIRKFFSQRRLVVKLAIGVMLFLFAVITPIADEIAGNIYFHHLCKTESGTKVYQTIELPSEYWDEECNPRFYDKNNGNLTLPLDQYANGKSEIIKRSFNIEERHSTLLDKQSGELLSEQIWFLFWGGWISNNFSPHNSADMCGSSVELTTEFVSKQFRPATKNCE